MTVGEQRLCPGSNISAWLTSPSNSRLSASLAKPCRYRSFGIGKGTINYNLDRSPSLATSCPLPSASGVNTAAGVAPEFARVVSRNSLVSRFSSGISVATRIRWPDTAITSGMGITVSPIFCTSGRCIRKPYPTSIEVGQLTCRSLFVHDNWIKLGNLRIRSFWCQRYAEFRLAWRVVNVVHYDCRIV